MDTQRGHGEASEGTRRLRDDLLPRLEDELGVTVRCILLAPSDLGTYLFSGRPSARRGVDKGVLIRRIADRHRRPADTMRFEPRDHLRPAVHAAPPEPVRWSCPGSKIACVDRSP